MDIDTIVDGLAAGQIVGELPTDPSAGFWYLGSPYTQFPKGLDGAYRLAVHSRAMLETITGRRVFSPIEHRHPIALRLGIDPKDGELWLRCDRPLMERALGLIVLLADTWQESRGLKEEICTFVELSRPVVPMAPGRAPECLKPVWLKAA